MQIAKDVLQFAKDPFEFAGDVLEANFGIFGASNEPNGAHFRQGQIAKCILKVVKCHLKVS
ncbi:hypothetical protein BZG01_06985 [Labilibaculum manganireducens]|uniref:Uncharacterized protein n=1 Tax=Labilibaculum manganireducens TaxID=1940525 RepID=A0A2N3IAZ6_9BACT|nr:hypothetical protein [Labilibaculum manganireducens]PKQ67479.1 hypothetical protein BZG01_06985 [Labilibaculum manganireducens]